MLEKLKGKKLLIIGGIPAMIEVVKRAQQFGITVYVTDYLEDSPAKKYADKSFMVSATDVEAVAALCRQENIDGIYTGNVDLLLPYYAQICEKTGLPCYGTKEQFDIMLDKGKFKNTCRQYGVPVIEEYETIDGITQYPVLVKPVDSSGSRGISICHNEFIRISCSCHSTKIIELLGDFIVLVLSHKKFNIYAAFLCMKEVLYIF